MFQRRGTVEIKAENTQSHKYMNVPEVCVTCVGELTRVSTCLHVHLDSEYAAGIGLWLELHQCWASQHLYNKSPARSYRCYVTLQSFTDTGVALPTMEAPFMGGGGWLIFCTGRWGWGTWVSLKLPLKVWKKKENIKAVETRPSMFDGLYPGAIHWFCVYSCYWYCWLVLSFKFHFKWTDLNKVITRCLSKKVKQS